MDRAPCMDMAWRVDAIDETRKAKSGITALKQFAIRLQSYWRSIVSRVRWPMHTGQLEGINNEIKVIRRTAYSYRDSDYYFVKIKAAFPGLP